MYYTIDAKIDGGTLGFSGGNDIQVVKVPNKLNYGSNIVFVGSAGFDGSAAVSFFIRKRTYY